MSLFGELRHLAARFFGVLFDKPLGPGAQDEVNRALTPAAATLFWEQHPIDQRHAYDVAMRVRAGLGEDRDAMAAALLHDVGKRHSDIGVVGRSLATVADALHLPMSANWRRYRNHEALGAKDLESIGAGPLAVAFARRPEEPPPTVDRSVWAALTAADDGIERRSQADRP